MEEVVLRVIFMEPDLSYTQGALAISSGTDNSPEARGQGVFMFNEGKDSTWYMGTRYNNADEWQIGRVAGASLDTGSSYNSSSGIYKVDKCSLSFNRWFRRWSDLVTE